MRGRSWRKWFLSIRKGKYGGYSWEEAAHTKPKKREGLRRAQWPKHFPGAEPDPCLRIYPWIISSVVADKEKQIQTEGMANSWGMAESIIVSPFHWLQYSVKKNLRRALLDGWEGFVWSAHCCMSRARCLCEWEDQAKKKTKYRHMIAFMHLHKSLCTCGYGYK